KREYWVHPIYSERLLKGKFYTLYHELRQYPSEFFDYCRMSVHSFDELLLLLKPHTCTRIQDGDWSLIDLELLLETQIK
ncbi:hypothetical protein B7P43_G00639, partial [Cryptotermes secundus]